MKSDIAVSRTRRLSKRLVVEITMSANGMVVEWEPREPKSPGDITSRELRRYFAARDAIAQEFARRSNEKVAMVTLLGGGRATLMCFHPDGRMEAIEP